MTYVVEKTLCDCHPETCCCPDFSIVDSNGETFMKLMDKKKALIIASALTHYENRT